MKKAWSIQMQMGLLVGSMAVIAALIFGFWGKDEARNIQIRIWEQSSQVLTRALIKPIGEELREQDWHSIRTIFSSLAQSNPNIEFILLLNETGQVVAASDSLPAGSWLRPVLDEIAWGKQKTIARKVRLANGDLLLRGQVIPVSPSMKLVAAIKYGAFGEYMDRVKTRLLIITLSAGIIILIVGLILMRRFTAPLRRLMETVQQFGEGKEVHFDSLPSGSAEINKLVEAFRESLELRQKAEKELRLYQDIVKTMQMGLHVYHLEEPDDDRTLRLISANPAAEQFTGLPNSEIIGRTIDENFPDLRAKKIPRLYASVVQEQRPLEIEELVYNRRRLPQSALAVKAFPLPDHCVGVLFEDISQRKQAEKALKAREEQYRRLYEETPVMMHSLDADFKIVSVNETWLKTLGYTREEVLGKSLLGFMDQESKEYAQEVGWPEFLKRGYVQDLSYQLIKKDGSICYVELSAKAYYNESGQLSHTHAFMLDVTDRAMTEAELHYSEAKNRALLAALPDVIFYLDMNGEYLDYVPAKGFETLVPPQEFIGKTIAEVLPEEIARQAEQAMARARETQQVQAFTYEMMMGGQNRYYEARIVSMNQDEFLVVVRDITEQRQTEQALRDSEQRFRSLAENAPNFINIIDGKGMILYINRVLPGFKREEIVGSTVWKYTLPEFHPAMKEVFRGVLKTGKADRYETSSPDAQGNLHYYETFVGPLYIGDKIDALILISNDMTKKKEAENQLLKSERRYRQLVETMQEGLWVIDRDAYTTYVNPRMAEMLGYQVEEMLGKHLFDFMDEHGVEIARGKLSHREEGNSEDHDFELLKKDGSRIYTRMCTNPLTDEQGNYVGALAAVADVTDRHEALESLRRSEELFRTLSRVAPVGIFRNDSDGKCTYANEKILEIMGCTLEEVLGDGWQNAIHPDDRGRVVSSWRQAVSENKLFETEYRFLRRDQSIAWVLVRAQSISGPGGQLLGFVGAAVEITKRKQSEEALQRTQNILLYTERLAKIGSWEWIFNTDEVIWSPEMYRQYRLNPREVKRVDFNTALKAIHPDDVPKVRINTEKALKTGKIKPMEYRLLLDDGTIRYMRGEGEVITDGNGLPLKMVGFAQDITQRKKAEELLKQHVFQQQAVARLGEKALKGTSISPLMREAVRVVARVLKVDYTKVLKLQPDRQTMVMEAGIGWPKGNIGKRETPVSDTSQAGFTLRSKKPTIVVDHRTETRFSTTYLYQNYQIRCGVDILIGDPDNPYGVLGAHSRELRKFSRSEVNFLVSIANILAEAIDRERAENLLKESEEKVRTILETLLDGVTVVDLNLGIQDVNQRSVELFGFQKKEDVLHRNALEFVSPSEHSRIPELLKIFYEKGFVENVEIIARRVDGQEFPAEVSAALLCDKNGAPAGIVVISRDVSKLKQAFNELQTSRERLRELATHLQHVREEERRAIAREIHDEFGQILTVLKMDLALLERELKKRLPGQDLHSVEEEIDRMNQLVDQTGAKMSALITRLRPEVLDNLGLIPALEWQIEDFQKHTGIYCDFRSDVSTLELEDDYAISLIRILQESLTNIARHSQATRVRVRLRLEDGFIRMSITDNGIGFKNGESVEAGHYGILGMKERAASHQGKLEVLSEPGQGARIYLEMPAVLSTEKK